MRNTPVAFFVVLVALQYLQPIDAGCLYTPDGSGHVTIPSNITAPDLENAFEDCKSLKSVTIPSNMGYIPHGMFKGSGLTSVVIPSNIREFKTFVFSGCTDLTNLTISANPNLVKISDSFCNDCKSLRSIVIPDTIKYIGKSAFSGSGLTSVSIPDSVEGIEDFAFFQCPELDSVTVGKDVPKLGRSVFATDPKQNEDLRCHKRCSTGPNSCYKTCEEGCTAEAFEALSCPASGDCRECPTKESAGVLSSRPRITIVLLLVVLVFLF